MRKKARDTQPSDLQIDLLLALYDEPRGSGELADAIDELRQRECPLATFYRQLQRVLDLGWVAAEAFPDEAERHARGRPERRYRITAAGSRVLRAGLELQRRRFTRARTLGLLAERAS